MYSNPQNLLSLAQGTLPRGPGTISGVNCIVYICIVTRQGRFGEVLHEPCSYKTPQARQRLNFLSPPESSHCAKITIFNEFHRVFLIAALPLVRQYNEIPSKRAFSSTLPMEGLSLHPVSISYINDLSDN